MKLKLTLTGFLGVAVIAALIVWRQSPSAQDSPPESPKARAKEEPAKEEPKPPVGEKTAAGLSFKVPYERGEGVLSFARQNGYLRVDVDVRFPYHGGDGQRDRGSSITLSLSADGLHGRHMIYYPSPVWLPDGAGGVAALRGEAMYDAKQGERRLNEQPTFAAASKIAHWDHFTAILYVDLRRATMPGNTPGSLADEWRGGVSAGSSAANMTFPAAMDARNPANTPADMLTFKLSELPELEELDDDPHAALLAGEKAMHDSMRAVNANLAAQDWPGTFKVLQKARKDFSEHLWPHFLAYWVSRQVGGQGVEGIDKDFVPMLKAYVDAAPGQSRAQFEYLDALLEGGKEQEAFAHFKTVDNSPLSTGRKQSGAHIRLEWCERIIPLGYAAEAAAILEPLAKDESLTKDNSFRVNLRLSLANLAQRQGDSAKAADLYKQLLTSEREFIAPKQLSGIQQMQQFQLQAKQQWQDELKFREEDAGKKNPRWIIETDKGRIVVELFQDDAPNTVASLVSLAQKNFYVGHNFHRVEPNFVAQGGCPKGDGTGSPGYRTKFEKNKRKHFRGTVAMARSASLDSQGSQFYICVSNGPSVISLSDNNYLVVGRVLEGMDVVDKIRRGDKIKTIRAENLRPGEYKPETLPE